MGLDGISINQLRITPELNSAELNSQIAINTNGNRIVDGLSNGQRVNPDKEQEHGNSDSKSNKKDRNEEEENEETTSEEVTKYDLSDANKFNVKLNSETNSIILPDKISGNTVQTIDADELLKFIQYSPNSYGSIINKKL